MGHMNGDTIPTTTCQGCGLTVEADRTHECYGRQAMRDVFRLIAMANRRTLADRILAR